MPIAFDRNLCCDLNETMSREWLVTNGRGSYSAGTIAGVLTRLEHGLLVTAPRAGDTPHVLVAKLDEEVYFDERTYYLGTNEYQDGTLSPSGFVHLESFRLENSIPTFTYRIGGLDGLLLEKRIWMPYGQAATYIQYRVFRSSASANYSQVPESSFYQRYFGRPPMSLNDNQSLTLTLLPLTTYRPYHQPGYGNNNLYFDVQPYQYDSENELASSSKKSNPPFKVLGSKILANPAAHPYHLLAISHPDSQATFLPTDVWYWHFLRRHAQAAGRPAVDDLYLPGVIKARLWPGELSTLTLIVTNEELDSHGFSPQQINQTLTQSIERQRSLQQPQHYFGEGGKTQAISRDPVILPLVQTTDPLNEGEEYLNQLHEAADHFIVRQQRGQAIFPKGVLQPFHEQEASTILLSSYYGMEERSRDMLIALPGLLLATRRYSEARLLLRTFARYFKQGLLPDYLPSASKPVEDLEYTNVDVALWYFYALDYYLRITRDYSLLDELLPQLDECIRSYKQGTLHGIKVDTDELILTTQASPALTWMNAEVDGQPVTPRVGKPVEVNALWYHALCLIDEWMEFQSNQGRVIHPTYDYQELRERCRASFQQRFWYEEGKYLYDLVDGPEGSDPAFRPNQIFALSLRHPAIASQNRTAILEQIANRLLTPYGLRTLAPDEKGYKGILPLHHAQLAEVLHQGSAWTWLLGAYIDALLQIKRTASGRLVDNDDLHLEYLWRKGLEVLEPFQPQFQQGILGMTEGVFNGDAPYLAGNMGVTATTAGELLRIYNLLAQRGLQRNDQAVIAFS